MFSMPWIFLELGMVICLPETVHWTFVTRRKNKAISKYREERRLTNSIQQLERELGIGNGNR